MKNPIANRLFLCFFGIFLLIIHIPFSIARSFTYLAFAGKSNVDFKSNYTLSSVRLGFQPSCLELYDSLMPGIQGLSREAFNYALTGFDNLRSTGKLVSDKILTVVDFSKPSYLKRLFVIDMKNRKVLFTSHVAHGQGSGDVYARNFSNVPSSLQSSLGFFETANTYQGRHGLSLKLKGLEQGVNDNAEERGIVIHAASYVNDNYIREMGAPGRSWGCPALPEKWAQPIIEKIKSGNCLFIFSADSKYLRFSPVLNSRNPALGYHRV